MPQKVPSSTKSSKSVTNKSTKPASDDSVVYQSGSLTPVQFVKGVGPRLGSVFASRDIKTVYDLLTFFPRDYEDRSRMAKVKELKDGVRVNVVESLEEK